MDINDELDVESCLPSSLDSALNFFSQEFLVTVQV